MNKTSFSLEVIVNGKPVQEYVHEGDTYIEGRKSSSFQLKFHNYTSKKVLIIPSVDGLSTLDGKPAGSDSTGIIVQPFNNTELPGWMVDLNKSSEFVFQERQNAYARQVESSTTNIGVIGVMVFEEAAQLDFVPIMPGRLVQPCNSPTSNPTWTTTGAVPISYNTSMTGSIYTSSANLHDDPYPTRRITKATLSSTEELGVGWGRSVDFKVNQTTFDKGNLVETLVIFYDNRKNLERKGIVLAPTPTSTRPNPFPGIGCKPPAGWRG